VGGSRICWPRLCGLVWRDLCGGLVGRVLRTAVVTVSYFCSLVFVLVLVCV
jgi:hypothetical protein